MNSGLTNKAREEDLLRKQIELAGKKLGLLLSLTRFSQEEKEALVEMMRYVPLEEIDDFISVLETKLLEAKTKEIDEGFAQEIKQIMEEYKTHQQELEEKTLAKLEKLEQDIKNNSLKE